MSSLRLGQGVGSQRCLFVAAPERTSDCGLVVDSEDEDRRDGDNADDGDSPEYGVHLTAPRKTISRKSFSEQEYILYLRGPTSVCQRQNTR
jgi:hypothetical protein